MPRSRDGPLYEMSDAAEGGLADAPVRLDQLPPLQPQNLSEMRSQACAGCVTVFAFIFMLAGMPHLVAPEANRFDPMTFKSYGLILLYIESGIAIICLLGLMWGDPGTLKRSNRNCFPLPADIADRLRKKQSLIGLENVYENGQVFCVRCCIWRPDPAFGGHVHHCSICQRCVRDFDHHCGVFGRCIAGSGFRGNMGYFKTILLMAAAGFFTCIITIAGGATACNEEDCRARAAATSS